MIRVLDDGTVMTFLTKDFLPVPEGAAELVKILEPNGTILWGVPDRTELTKKERGPQEEDEGDAGEGETPRQTLHEVPSRKKPYKFPELGADMGYNDSYLSKAEERLVASQVLYMEIPQGPFACGNCMMWISGRKRCMIHGEDVEVRGDMICGLYVNGHPEEKGEAETFVTPEVSGLGAGMTNCGNCRWGGGSARCLHPALSGWKIDAQNGCCNAWHGQGESEISKAAAVLAGHTVAVDFDGTRGLYARRRSIEKIGWTDEAREAALLARQRNARMLAQIENAPRAPSSWMRGHGRGWYAKQFPRPNVPPKPVAPTSKDFPEKPQRGDYSSKDKFEAAMDKHNDKVQDIENKYEDLLDDWYDKYGEHGGRGGDYANREHEAVSNYTKDDEGDPRLLNRVFDKVQPTPVPMKVFRGLGLSDDKIKKLVLALRHKAPVVLKTGRYGFASSSANYATAKEFAEDNAPHGAAGAVLEILVPKGSKVLPVQAVSGYPEEREIVLRRPRVRIVGVRVGKTTIFQGVLV